MLQLFLFITYSNYVVTDSTRPSILAFENDVAMTAKKIDRFLVLNFVILGSILYFTLTVLPVFN